MRDATQIDTKSLEAALESIDTGIIFLDSNLNVLYANAFSRHIVGEDAIGRPLTELFDGLHRSDFETSVGTTIIVNKRDDTTVQFSVVIRAIADTPTVRYLVQVNTFTSERVSLSVDKFEGSLAFAFKTAQAALWSWDLQSNSLEIDSRFSDIFNIDMQERVTEFGRLIQIIHVEDVTRIEQAMNEYLSGKTSEFQVEFRLLTGGNEWRWVRGNAQILERDSDGRPLKLVGLLLDIDDLKHVEAEYKRIASYLDRIINTIPSMILIADEQMEIQRCNRAAIEALGYTEGELKGLPLYSLFARNTSREEVDARAQLLGREGMLRNIDLLLRRKDGSTFPALVTYVKLVTEEGKADGILFSALDVSEREEALKTLRNSQEALRAERDRIKMYFELSQVFLIALDVNGTIILINREGSELLGKTPEELVGTSWFEFVPERERKIVRERFQKLVRGEIKKIDGVLRPVITTDGEERIIRWRTTVTFDAEGNINGILSSGVDVTEQLRIEMVLKRERSAFRTVAEVAIEEKLTPASITKKLLDTLSHALGFSVGVIGLYNPEDNVLSYTALVGVDPQDFPLTLHLTPETARHYLVARAALTREPIVCSDIRSCEPYSKYRSKIGNLDLRAMVILPIVDSTGLLLGVISFTSSKPIRHLEEDFLFFKTLSGMIATVIERAKSLEALQRSEQKFRSLILEMPEGIGSTDFDNHFVLVNKAFADMLGYTPEEMIGTSVFDYVKPDDLELVTMESKKRRQGKTSTYLLRLRHKDGSYRVIRVSAIPSRDQSGKIDGTIAVLVDVTEQIKVQDNLRASEETWRSLVENAPNVIATLDFEGRFQFVNRRFMGLEPAELISKKVTDTLPSDIADTIITVITEIEQTGATLVFLSSYTDASDGSTKWYRITAAPIFHGTTPKEILMISTDVTDIKRAEDEVRRLNEDLSRLVDARTAELQATNKELEAFVYSVSHDLRAPLRSIIGFSQALLEDHRESLDDEGTDFLARIVKASNRMARLIDDLLKLSRITRRTLDRKVIDLSAIATEIIDDLRAQEPKRKVRFTIQKNLLAWCDERAFRIVLQNLLSNAWKFTSKTSNARIEFSSQIIDNEQVFLVRDNGAGFDMHLSAKLFQPFQRLHRSEDFEGYGIGLATVKRLIEKHGGRIWAEAEIGKGATFYFTIPKGASQSG
ncbi:MAG: PAS domain S-box protein [Candidatus Thorarchaeota archaeon]|nr:PAS domain S-box protein [Candidatus Thorarchaeota archaeon]